MMQFGKYPISQPRFYPADRRKRKISLPEFKSNSHVICSSTTTVRMYESRLLVQAALKDGLIARPETCSQCVNTQTRPLEAHHTDYLKPLDVTWLCKKCHHALHKKNVEPSYINAEGPIMDWSIYDLDTYRAKPEQERAA